MELLSQYISIKNLNILMVLMSTLILIFGVPCERHLPPVMVLWVVCLRENLNQSEKHLIGKHVYLDSVT